MPKELRHLICLDLDGPILDVSERYYRVYRDTLRQHATEPLSKHAYWDLKRKKISEPEILAQSGVVDRDAITKYLDARAQRIESSDYLLFDRLWPATRETLKLLGQDADLALVTMRKSAELLNMQLERLGLLDTFDCVLAASKGSDGIDRARLKSDLVRRQYHHCEIEGWFVGDTEIDIRSGRLLGLRTVAITFGIRTVEQFATVSPDVLLHSPGEFHCWAEQKSHLD